jgi:hypothetical protein
MVETLIIAGAIIASAILIYSKKPAGESEEVRVRRMARSLVRSIEKRSEWDETINTEHIKFTRCVIALSEEFDLDTEWIHIIVGEAQFDMESDRGLDSFGTIGGTVAGDFEGDKDLYFLPFQNGTLD